jgi:hypothetical protein
MGVSRGNQAVIAATMATVNEFPDRQLFAEDVIFSEDETHGFLSSHRITSTGTLIHYWPMNEGGGSTHVDVIGGNNGTVVNAQPGDWELFTRLPGVDEWVGNTSGRVLPIA